MARDSVVSSRSITKIRVGSKPFIDLGHISAGMSRTEMLTKGVMYNSPVVLRRLVEHCLDFLVGNPSKIRFQLVEAWKHMW